MILACISKYHGSMYQMLSINVKLSGTICSEQIERKSETAVTYDNKN